MVEGELVKIRTGTNGGVCGLLIWVPGEKRKQWLLTGKKHICTSIISV